MKIYLLRHGSSPSAPEAGVNSDFERPLAASGRKDARRTAEHLNSRGARPAVLLVSPLKRAQQTADEAAAALVPSPERLTYAPLANEIPGPELYQRVIKDLPSFPIAKDAAAEDRVELLLVGHQPQLGEMAEHLTGRFFNLKPAGLIAIEFLSGKVRTHWAINPDEIPAR